MNKILLFLVCILAFMGSAQAQWPRVDTLSGAQGTLLSSNWTSVTSMNATCGQDSGSTSTTVQSWYIDCVSVWTGDAFSTAGQSITATRTANAGNDVALMILTSSTTGNGYRWYYNSGTIQVFTADTGGSSSPANTCPNPAVGDVVRLAAVAGVLYCIDVTTNVTGTWADTTYTTGGPAIYIGNSGEYATIGGPIRVDCYPLSCNSVSASPYTPTTPWSNVIDYYSPNAITVTLTPQTAGWVSCYTIDGTTPTATTAGTCTHGNTYSAPFVISTTGLTTVKTIATKSGSVNSAENDYVYNVGYQVPAEGGCQLFPANSIFNANIAALPVQTTYNTAFQGVYSGTYLSHDFYYGSVGGGSGGIPYNVFPSGTTGYTPTFDVSDESDAGPYNITTAPMVEGEATNGCNVMPADSADHHLLAIVSTSCQLQEIYQYSCAAGTPNVQSGYSGAIWSLSSNVLRTDTWTSADAAGLPITPFLVKYDEAVSGVISHPLRFTLNTTGDVYLWPARHSAGKGGVLPTGARIRLKASFDISGFSPINKVILTAMKNYGMFEADNGRNGLFQGVSDPRWNEADLDLINAITFSNFEVVDESSLMLNSNSQQIINTSPPKVHWRGNAMAQ